MRWGFDIESNGLLDTIHTIWCIVLRELDTGEVRTFNPDQIEEALAILISIKGESGHNF